MEYDIVELNDGKRYYKKGTRISHREDGPAVEINGNKFWYINGKNHREDGPANEYSDGYKEWYIGGIRHREDGPACECSNGDKAWYLNGKLHREDGPAVEYANGEMCWFIKGIRLSPEKEAIMNTWCESKNNIT